MHIIVVEQNGHGGLVHYAYQMCTALADQGEKVTLITAHDYELVNFPHNFEVRPCFKLWPLFDSSAKKFSSSFYPVKLVYSTCWLIRRSWRGLKLIVQWFNVTYILVRLKPDIIQFGKINFPFEAFFLAYLRRQGIPLSQICHEFERRERDGLLTRRIDKLYASVFQQFFTLFFHSEENCSRFHELFHYPKEHTHVIPHGNESIFLNAAAKAEKDVSLMDRYGVDNDIPVIVFFGILSPSKGILDLLEAFSIVLKKNLAHLVIAGYPSKYFNVGELQEKINELCIKDQVTLDFRYLPFNEISSLMKLARVVVFPYHSSTQSGAIQVAYTFGRPVIATKVGGLPEAVMEGESGFLVPPRAPEVLADKIITLVNDPGLAAMMGSKAKHLSETNYSWQPIARKIIKTYQSLLTMKSSHKG